jgi:lipopolysaccharide transport system ATP-binding protein
LHREVVGIIGRNGIGKSTLLKRFCPGLLRLPMGWWSCIGKWGHWLEVGTGYHLELIARENIFYQSPTTHVPFTEKLMNMTIVYA